MIVKLLPYQMEFLRSSEKFVWLCAGLGSGKSYALAHYCIERMLTNPETIGLICAATYSQLRDSILTELFRQLDMLGLKYSYSTLTGFLDLHANGARVKTFSLENYEVLRGIEVGWIAIDEACLAKEDAYKVAIGRLRCKYSKRLECRIVSTPKGFDYLYDRYYGEKLSPGHKLIHATAHDNPHLPAGYLDSLAAGYDERMYRQEVMAEFVSNAEGNVYHAFDRNEHASGPIDRVETLPIWVGMDFNVNPMTAVLANIKHGSLFVFDELYLKNANTFLMRDELKKRYPKTQIKIAPDRTGQARKTSSTKSDHEILREAGFLIVPGRTNPAVEDRYNTVNGRLTEGRISIDKTKCPMLLRDLERVTHETNPDYLTHISDALGYLAWHTFPIKKARPQSRVVQL
jgi:phage terminase large subunit